MTRHSSPVVLVIDSDPIVLTATAAVLHCSQFFVHCAQTAEAAARARDELELDLVLCDVDVGGVPGSDIAALFRQNPARPDVPVVYTSSCQLPEVVCRSSAEGAEYHLRKPFDPQVLCALVDNAAWGPRFGNPQIDSPHYLGDRSGLGAPA